MKRAALIAAFFVVTAAVAQAPNIIWGVVFSAQPTLSNGQQYVWRGNTNGKLVTDIVTGVGCNGVVDLSAGCMFPLAH